MAQPNANSSFQKTLINNDPKKSYMKKDILGRGSFGIVFRASYHDVEVAVKRLELERLDPDDREIKLQIKLEHDYVLKILSVDEDEDYKYIFLELCAGTLSQVINNKYKGPSFPTDKQVMYQIADGLDYIHSQNVIHRDIKPENILISMTGQMKLSDFGLSKQVSTGSAYSFSGLKGTLLWMAPELRSKNESARVLAQMSDIFPCGCVFFVFLTREKGPIHPFGDTEDHIEIQNNIRKGKSINFDELNSDHFASPVIRKMIDRNPLKRISAKEVKNSLKNNNYTTEGKISSNLIKGYSFKVKMNSFKKTMKIEDARCGDFHPTAPILAIGLYNRPILLLKGSNYFDSTRNWEDQGRPSILRGSEGYHVSIKWNTNGTKLATGFYEGVVSIWNYPSCVLLAEYSTNFTYPTILWNPFSNDVLAAHQTSFRGYRVFLISCSNFRTPLIELKSSSSLCCLDWISENKLACGFEDGSIEIHELIFKAKSTRLDKRFEHNENVWSIAWNDDWKQLAACSGDGCIQIWSCDSETPVAYSRAECRENDEYPKCRSLAWYPIGKCAGADATSKLIVCGLSSQEIVVWSLSNTEQNQNPIRCLGGHSKKVLQVVFSPNGRFLASNGYLGEVIVWSTQDWQKIDTLPGNFWINSWNATSCKLVISEQTMSRSGEKDLKVIEIGTDGKSEISAGRGRKRKNSE